MKCMTAVLVGGLVSAAAPVSAQPAGWTVTFSGGVVAPSSQISSRLSTGWGIDAGVGYEFTPWLTLLGEFGFAGLGVPPDILQQFQAPQGQGRVYSLNIEPQIRFPLPHRLKGFVEGGGGWIRRTVELTSPTIQYVDVYDPYYGDLGPQPYPDNQVLNSTTRTAFGLNVGGGVSIPVTTTGVSLFVDVRYYRAQTSPRATAMIPVLFGIKYTASPVP